MFVYCSMCFWEAGRLLCCYTYIRNRYIFLTLSAILRITSQPYVRPGLKLYRPAIRRHSTSSSAQTSEWGKANGLCLISWYGLGWSTRFYGSLATYFKKNFWTRKYQRHETTGLDRRRRRLAVFKICATHIHALVVLQLQKVLVA